MSVEFAARDQDGPKRAPAPASKRVSSVWGRGDHNSPDATPTSAISPGGSFHAEDPRVKRQEAAKWMESLTGELVPFASDQEFRSSLNDGVLLCNVMNMVAPGTVQVLDKEGGLTKQRYENVANFIQAACGMGVPGDYMFSIGDLEYDGAEDRPRVAQCILWLKRLHMGNGMPSPMPLPHGFHNDLTASDSPRKAASQAAVTRALHKQPGMQGSPVHPAQQSSLSSAQHKGMQSATGVARLMQQCTVMLKEKMSFQVESSSVQLHTQTIQRATSSDAFSFEAVGPVLESVLGGLTQEYERRLLSKDQEIQTTKEKMNHVSKQVEVLTAQLSQLKLQLLAQQEQAAAESSQASKEMVEELQERVNALEDSLREREEAVESLQQELSGKGGAEAAKCAALEYQLSSVQEKLQYVDHIEEKYKNILDENRKLYNQVQDLRGAIRVFCRIRPSGRTGDNSEPCVDVGGEGEVAVYDTKGERKIYKFDRVFGESTTQEEIYADTQPLIRSVLDGYNVCIFAYGQTGSGKTHTMSGTNVEDYEGRGINYRALDDLFHLRDTRAEEVEYNITVQMLEVYNEQLRDLLIDSRSAATPLVFQNTMPSGQNVKGAVQIPVHNTDDVLRMMERGARNRHSAETKMNERSSRSHQVLTVIVDGANMITGARTHACLHLVDLAGSERTAKSGAEGDRMTEAKHINKSLSALGDVMSALASKQSHVPFRNSMLTQLLTDSLQGQAKVMMFMHIAPESTSFMESTSTLGFASRVSEITLGQARKNVESGEVFKAHEEIQNLRQRLARESQDKQRVAEELERRLDAERAEKEQLRQQLSRLERQAAQQPAVSSSTTFQSAIGCQSVDSKYQPHLSPAPPARTPHAMPPVSPLPLSSIREDKAQQSMTPMSARSNATHATRIPAKTPGSGFASARPSGCYTPTQPPVQSSAIAAIAAQSSMAAPSTRPSTATSNRLSMDSAASLRSSSVVPKSARTSGMFGSTAAKPPAPLPQPSMSMRTSGVYGAPRPSTASKPADSKAPVPQSAGGRSAGGMWGKSMAPRFPGAK